MATTEDKPGTSWGADVRLYQTQKQSIPWKPEQQEKVFHVTRYQKSRQERDYDIVLGKYRDDAKELQATKSMQQDVAITLTRAKDKQVRYSQKFDLINHRSKLAGLPKEANDSLYEPTPKPINTNVGYNIISGLDFEVHHFLPPDQRPRAATTMGKNHSKLVRKEGHGFSVISNKYFENHDEKISREEEDVKKECAKKYWKTHDFNVINASYYDNEKERLYKERQKQEQQSHGVHRVDKLPERLKYSEGVQYNILNQQIIDQAKFEKMSNIINRSVNGKNALKSETRIQDEAAKLFELHGTRALNRISYRRITEGQTHGFDPITNETFQGRTAKSFAGTTRQPPLSNWAKIELFTGPKCLPGSKGRDLSGEGEPQQIPSTRGNNQAPTRSKMASADIMVVEHTKPIASASLSSANLSFSTPANVTAASQSSTSSRLSHQSTNSAENPRKKQQPNSVRTGGF